MKNGLKLSALVLFLIMGWQLPESVAETKTLKNKYTDARVINRPPPKYPRNSARKLAEGWVDILFTVNADATIGEIEVTDYSGVEAFLEAAITSVSQYEYLPAKLDGENVPSTHEIRINFMMQSSPRAASLRFVKTYRKFQRAIKKQDWEASLEHLQTLRKLKAHNFYENAYLNLAEYYFSLIQQTDPIVQIGYLKSATRIEGEKPYIPWEAWLGAQRSLFSKQTNTARYGGALETFERIPETKRTQELRQELSPIVAQIRALRANETPFTTSLRLNSSGFGSILLLKPVFTVADLAGRIERFRVFCDSGAKGIPFIDNAEYEIPRTYGECQLRIKGTPNSTFSLIQFPRQRTN